MNTDLNIALLRDSVLWVEKEDKRPLAERNWNQENWATFATWQETMELVDGEEIYGGESIVRDAEVGACGALYCVAGKIVIDAGLTEVREHPEDGYEIRVSTEKVMDLLPALGKVQYFDWQEVAMHLLGITEGEAEALFSGDNTAERVREVATEIATARGEVL